MIKHEIRSCPRCGVLTTVKVRRPNHALHAIMTLLTMGFWLPIWLLAIIEGSFSRGKVKCPRGCSGRSWWG